MLGDYFVPSLASSPVDLSTPETLEIMMRCTGDMLLFYSTGSPPNSARKILIIFPIVFSKRLALFCFPLSKKDLTFSAQGLMYESMMLV